MNEDVVKKVTNKLLNKNCCPICGSAYSFYDEIFELGAKQQPYAWFYYCENCPYMWSKLNKEK